MDGVHGRDEMHTTFVLILMWVSLGGTALTSVQGYHTKELCVDAGQAAEKKNSNFSFTCIPGPGTVYEAR
jgi:hypothetical protein